ncbi:ABC transporter permease [Paracoccus seriniphilus]|uniref:NitT/TauT family transport system permease protein/taurine transport system permease protein n=1 Tax=Paracoccus seriniphilus TaxID=184748 RepID=A0A239PUG8_9RHOB|nr:ABC transporter permease [Paracoccus seriniphilus]WCR16496.1 ABC transporter permease [Paracoccus seriniphilus]SNT73673.1 NitT/TauT family transport system permease protein/taurine transport system permease protein [Paracoccus seriniphilus]
MRINFLNKLGLSESPRLPFLYGAASLLTLLALWVLSTSVLDLVDARTLPSPVEVIGRFLNLVVEPFSGSTLIGHVGASLYRWALGVGAAILLGVPVGILFAWVPAFRAVFNPIFEVLRYIPPFAWVPIAILWFGASTATQAMVVFIAAFPACVINAQLGVQQVDPILVRAAKVLGAGQGAMLRRVVVPVAAPAIFTGLRIAISNGWMALVGAELVVGKVGLGFLISQGQNNDSVSTIFVGIIAIGTLGVLIDGLLQRSETLLLPWRKPRAQRDG